MIKNKIKTLLALKRIITGLKKRQKKIVFTNGCFDIIHLGHVTYLEKAKKSGDILIVGLNSDRSVKQIKGDLRPLVPQDERAALLAALESVDYVVIFNEDNPYNLISQVNPDVLVKGGDWGSNRIIGADFVKSRGGKVKRIKYLEGYSVTKLIKKLQRCMQASTL